MQMPKGSSPDAYEVIEKLGQGSFGEVLLVHRKGAPQESFAMKRIRKAQIVKFQKLHEAFIEKQILAQFNQLPNNRCIKLYETFSDEEYIYMILQNCEGGALDKYITEISQRPPKDAQSLITKIAAKVLVALQQLHKAKVIHRDLKPSNVLLTNQGDVKLADFGSAYAPSQFYTHQAAIKINEIKKMMNERKEKKMGQDQKQQPIVNGAIRKATFVGTPYYMAPELLSEDICGMEADIWAFGCIIYEMVSGKPPFHDNNEGLVWKKILSEQLTLKQQKQTVPHSNDIVRQLLKKDRSKRLGCYGEMHKEIKRHPFFDTINWKQIETSPVLMLQQLLQQKRLTNFKKKASVSKNNLPKILLSGVVLKKMLFGNFKERMLVLNSRPELIYYDTETGDTKGDISLKKNTPISLEGKHFTVTNERKTYYFKSAKATEWVEMMKSSIVNAYY